MGGVKERIDRLSVFVEQDAATGLLIGHVPGWPGAYSQGTTLEELRNNVREVALMLLEDGTSPPVSDYVCVTTVFLD